MRLAFEADDRLLALWRRANGEPYACLAPHGVAIIIMLLL